MTSGYQSTQPRRDGMAPSPQKLNIKGNESLPPLFVRDEAVIVDIHVPEEAVELFARDGEPGTLESSLELVHVELSVPIFIDSLEEGQELTVSLLDKVFKLCVWLAMPPCKRLAQ